MLVAITVRGLRSLSNKSPPPLPDGSGMILIALRVVEAKRLRRMNRARLM